MRLTLRTERNSERGDNMVRLKVKGSFKKTMAFFKKASSNDLYQILVKYANEGVLALQQATPKRTGKTAASWEFEIEQSADHFSIFWSNSNIVNGLNIALLIQLGHGTGRGVYVSGVNYIDPALQPVFERMAKKLWLEVVDQ